MPSIISKLIFACFFIIIRADDLRENKLEKYNEILENSSRIFNGNLYKTITGNSRIYTLATSNYFGEFAVGFNNGSITIFDNFGRYKRSFIVVSSIEPSYLEIYGIRYFLNGDIGTTGKFGTKIFSNSGIQKMYFDSCCHSAISVLTNGEVAYGLSSFRGGRIYIQNPSLASPRLILSHSQYYGDTIRSLLALANGDLVSGSFGSADIKIWNTLDGSLKQSLLGHTRGICSLILLENDSIASGSYDRTIRIWNINTGTAIKVIPADIGDYSFNLMSLLPSENIAIASLDRTIKIWDKDNEILIKTLYGHTDYVTSLAVNSNNFLVSVSLDKTIKIWN
ncbi:unnamed protein product [Brachionus calyciflorus]|uniref:Uncharacterized protein n=1 Tax=Brachionus calyciflorus TaxID=104777 RepID=A0A814IFW3_9BILA|nr:unnamed protein product [Brachionus calyciflorus]